MSRSAVIMYRGRPSEQRLLPAVALLAAIAAAPAEGLAAVAAPVPAAPPAADEALVGRWWGTIVAPHETVEFGLEVRRDEHGRLGATITQPGANYFDMALPGAFERSGDRVTFAGLGLEGTLAGDRIYGKVGRTGVPFDLRRTDTLPQRPAVPELPTGPGPRWQTRLNGQAFASPVVADGIAYVGTTGGVFHAVRTSDGAFAWTFPAGRPIFGAAPAIVDGVLYVGSSDLGRVSAIDPADGRVLWRTGVFGWTFGTPLVVGDRIYVGAAGGTPYFIPHVAGLCVLDRRTGRLVERWPLPDPGGAHQWGIASSLALAGDTVVATTIDGSIYRFPLRSGRRAAH